MEWSNSTDCWLIVCSLWKSLENGEFGMIVLKNWWEMTEFGIVELKNDYNKEGNFSNSDLIWAVFCEANCWTISGLMSAND